MQFFLLIVLSFYLVCALFISLDALNLIEKRKGMIHSLKSEVRTVARCLNIDVANIQEAFNNIGNLHSDITNILVLGFDTSLVKEGKGTINIDDAFIRQNIDIINVVQIEQRHRNQQA